MRETQMDTLAGMVAVAGEALVQRLGLDMRRWDVRTSATLRRERPLAHLVSNW